MDLSLLDTDVISEILRGRNKKVTVQAAKYRRQFGQLTISTLSVLEIVAGLARHKRDEGIAKFLRFALTEQVVSLDVESAEIAGRIHGALQSQGLSIGVVDPMIAAIAIRNGFVLATGNTEHYATRAFNNSVLACELLTGGFNDSRTLAPHHSSLRIAPRYAAAGGQRPRELA